MSDDTFLDRLVKIAAEDKEFALAAREHLKFVALSESQAWVALEKHVNSLTEKAVKQIAAVILSGEEVDQRELDRLRGYVKGMQAVVNFPKTIDADFDKQLERAWRRATAQAAQSGDDTEQEA